VRQSQINPCEVIEFKQTNKNKQKTINLKKTYLCFRFPVLVSSSAVGGAAAPDH
jgi:hypothetical protein